MLQFHIEVICNFIGSLAYLFIAILFLKHGFHRKNLPLLILFIFSLGFMVSAGLQGLSFVIVLEDYSLAISLKVVSSIINKLTSVVFFIWIDYVQYERIRFLSILPIVVVDVCFITTVFTTESFRLYNYYENGSLIAVSIGKVGLAIVWDNAAALLLYLAMIWYFVMQLRHATPNLKHVTKVLVIILFIILGIGATIQLTARSLPENSLALVLYSIMVILPAIPILAFSFVVVRVPQLLYILGFQVFRLFIIHGGSGKSIFNYRFRYQPVDEALFSNLLQGMQQLSLDVLHAGDLREIRYEYGVVMLHRYPLFIVGLLGSRWSKYLATCVDKFARVFEDQFRTQLEKSSGNANDFDGTVPLVDKIFEYVPRDAQNVQSTDWTPGPQRVPTRK